MEKGLEINRLSALLSMVGTLALRPFGLAARGQPPFLANRSYGWRMT
jgi:hypothetical protein